MSTLVIARSTVREASRRKLLLAGAAVSVAFVGLVTLGFVLLERNAPQELADPTFLAIAATTLTVLSLYAVQFLAAFLAILLSVTSVATEVDSGRAHAVLARPIGRASWMWQRWAGFTLVAALYAAVMAVMVLIVARIVLGYGAIGPWRAIGFVIAEVVTLALLGLALSTRLSSIAAGVIGVAAFGLGWIGGIVGFIGEVLGNLSMQRVETAVTLLVPSDALWRAASYYLQSPAFLLTAATGAGSPGETSLPFASLTPPTTGYLLWVVAWCVLLGGLATRHFVRADL